MLFKAQPRATSSLSNCLYTCPEESNATPLIDKVPRFYIAKLHSYISNPRISWSLFLSFFLSQFAHNLCDVHRTTGSQLGLLCLLLLPQDDGTQTGPSLFGILLQLGITERRQKVTSYDISTLVCIAH